MKCRIPIPGFTYREYELDLFGIESKVTSLLRSDILDKYLSFPIEKFFFKFRGKDYFFEPDPYKFNRRFFELKNGAVIEGYFNSVLYFQGAEKLIQKTFDTQKLFDPTFKRIEEKVNSHDSVSVNIRRGDYLNKKHTQIFTHLDETYYREAIKVVKSKVKNPHFFVFSYDDPEWFEQTLQLSKKEYTLVANEYSGERNKTHLRLISLCRHNIISNSTFAFWGAYLNKNTKKTVICPKKWSHVWEDFEIPAGWTAIENS
jgi:hypothetical protein